jgi:Ca2+-binding RTX toxin-like protein
MRSGRAFLAVAVGLGLALAAATGISAAETLVGTKSNELLAGTHAGDRLNGKAGNDLLKGKAGNDLLIGGPGRDTLVGGPGRDRIIGGPGNDVVKATDGRPDKVIDGGGGANTCVIDIPVDLSATINCNTLQAGPVPSVVGGGGPGGGQNGGDALEVTSAQGLTCFGPLGCLFTITGKGADALTGGVSSGGAVTSLANVAVNGVVTGTWLATGTYSCGTKGATGWLQVTMGTKSTPHIPVQC